MGDSSAPLERVRRSTSEQVHMLARRLPSMPLPVAVPSMRSPRKVMNSTDVAERRRRRRTQLDSTSSVPRVAPIPVHLIQEDTASSSLLSPRQIMCVGNYDLGRTIGRGQFGKVKIATHVLTGEKGEKDMLTREQVAVKIIQKKKLKGDSLELIHKEIDILKSLHHPNIITLYEVLETDRVVFLILELANGGEALDFVVTHGKLTEEKARTFLRQIASAVSYCHQHHIAHRDLKGENLLLDDDLNVKVIDFGLSTLFQPGQKLTMHCGSPAYAAPELLLKEPYDGPQIDMWSMGVILYVFVCGVLPFKSDIMRELYAKVMCGDYVLPDHLSEGCKDVIRALLCVDPKVRLTMKELLEHPWVVGNDGWQRPNDGAFPALTKDSIDMQIIHEMELFGFKPDTVMDSLIKNSFDPATATFNLLKSKKVKSPRIPSNRLAISGSGPVYLKGIVSMPNSMGNSPMHSQGNSPQSKSPLSSQEIEAPPLHYRGVDSSAPNSRVSPRRLAPRPTLLRVHSQSISRNRSVSNTEPRAVKMPSLEGQVKRKRSTSDNQELAPDAPSRSPEHSRLRFAQSSIQKPTPEIHIELHNELESAERLSITTPKRRTQPTFSSLGSNGLDEKRKASQGRTILSTDCLPPPNSIDAPRSQPVTKPVWDDLVGLTVPPRSRSPVNSSTYLRRQSATPQRLTREQKNWSSLPEEGATKSQFSSQMKSLTRQIRANREAEERSGSGPRSLRSPISATSDKNPEDILDQIKAYFTKNNIPFEPVGPYALKGLHVTKNVRFEVEVCNIPNLQQIYSIRMQRIDGDWESYKDFCSECLLELKL